MSANQISDYLLHISILLEILSILYHVICQYVIRYMGLPKRCTKYVHLYRFRKSFTDPQYATTRYTRWPFKHGRVVWHLV